MEFNPYHPYSSCIYHPCLNCFLVKETESEMIKNEQLERTKEEVENGWNNKKPDALFYLSNRAWINHH